MNEVKNKLRFGLSLPLIFFGIIMVIWPTSEANATHIIGGNMYYKCLGNDMYEITFEIRRDCIHGADDAPHRTPHIYLSVYTRDGQFCPRRGDNGYIRLNLQRIDTLNTNPDDFCIDPGDEVCVSQATYVGIACLPANKEGHILAYQRCCRNEILNNIEDPEETGGTWYVDITGDAMMECNNNPVYNAWPPVYICQNDDLVFDHSATDMDGDSLVYSLCTPHSGATRAQPAPTKASAPPYDSIVWLNPYDRTDMMGGTPLRIDPQTGIMTARPDMRGTYLIGVMVREYRNGQLIGYVKRDFQFNVVACGDRPTADFEIKTDSCDGLTQVFENNSIDATNYTWLFDYPNRQPTSTDENPTHTYDSAGVYQVMLIAENDQGCRDSILKEVTVFDPQLMPDFLIEVDCIDSLKLTLTDLSTSNDSIVEWRWELSYPGGVLNSTLQNPMFVLDEDGTVVINLTIVDENGCDSTITKTENVNLLDLEFISDTIQICLGDSTKLLLNGNPDYTYTWTPTDGLKLNPPHDPVACPDTTTEYCVTVSDSVCQRTGCVLVIVQDTVPIEVMGPDSTCNGKVDLMAVVADTTLEIRWYDDPSWSDLLGTGDKFSTTINQTTTFYAVVNQDEDCPSVASWTVTVFDAVIENIERNRVICFGGGMIELNPNGDTSYLYSWSPGEFLDDSTSHNPKATLDTSTKFTVIVTNPLYPECPDTIMVQVDVGDDFEIINFPPDTTFCSFDSVKYTIELSKGDLTVEWCDVNGNVIDTGRTICFVPNEIDSLIAKVTDEYDCLKTAGMKIFAYDIDVDIMFPDSLCFGDTAMIMLVNNGPDTLDVSWSPSETIIGDTTGYVIKVNPSETTTYTAVIRDGSGCEWERMVTINIGGFINGVDATADPRVINPGESTQLDVNPGGVSYMWTGEGLDMDDIKDPTATPPGIDTYVYEVKVTDEQGCMGTDTVIVTVRVPDCVEGVFLPNAFSPNGDGQNDVLFVRSNVIIDMELQIFNRWGQMVFSSTSIQNGWNGTYNGQPLPPDVYGYVLWYRCIDNEEYMKEGNVSLIK